MSRGADGSRYVAAVTVIVCGITTQVNGVEAIGALWTTNDMAHYVYCERRGAFHTFPDRSG